MTSCFGLSALIKIENEMKRFKIWNTHTTPLAMARRLLKYLTHRDIIVLRVNNTLFKVYAPFIKWNFEFEKENSRIQMKLAGEWSHHGLCSVDSFMKINHVVLKQSRLPMEFMGFVYFNMIVSVFCVHFSEIKCLIFIWK